MSEKITVSKREMQAIYRIESALLEKEAKCRELERQNRELQAVVDAAMEALNTALRQWEMYSNENRTNAFIEETEDDEDIKAMLYRKCKQALADLDKQYTVTQSEILVFDNPDCGEVD